MKENRKFLIIPDCSDHNRGDQALVWETKRIAEKSGFLGEYYLICEDKELAKQSQKEGINIVSTVLSHPSKKMPVADNIQYSLLVKLKWGVVLVSDLIVNSLLLNKYTRKIGTKFINKNKRESLKIFQEADAVFVKGGGFLHSSGGIVSYFKIKYLLYHINLALSLKKEVYVMPNSFGPFEGVGVKKQVYRALSRCKLVTAREDISRQMIKKQLNMDIPVYADLGFYLQKEKNQITGQVLKNLEKSNRKLVAITMRPYRFEGKKDADELYSKYKRALAEFVEWLYEQEYLPVLVVHTLAMNQHENDAACIFDIVESLEKSRYCLINDSEFNCRDLKEIYSNCSYIVGTRFHSVIFAISEMVPAIAITYGGNKGQGIMNSMQLEEYAIPMEEISLQILISKFNKLVLNEKYAQDKIKKYLAITECDRIQLIQTVSGLTKKEKI